MPSVAPFAEKNKILTAFTPSIILKVRNVRRCNNTLPKIASKYLQEVFMELAKVTSKGQITIPLIIRNLLQLKTGDKVFFEENNGKVYIANASQITLANVQTKMEGEAKNAGFETEDDVVAYIKELRKSK